MQMIRFQPCYVDGRSDDEYAIDIRDLNSKSFHDVVCQICQNCRVGRESFTRMSVEDYGDIDEKDFKDFLKIGDVVTVHFSSHAPKFIAREVGPVIFGDNFDTSPAPAPAPTLAPVQTVVSTFNAKLKPSSIAAPPVVFKGQLLNEQRLPAKNTGKLAKSTISNYSALLGNNNRPATVNSTAVNTPKQSLRDSVETKLTYGASAVSTAYQHVVPALVTLEFEVDNALANLGINLSEANLRELCKRSSTADGAINYFWNHEHLFQNALSSHELNVQQALEKQDVFLTENSLRELCKRSSTTDGAVDYFWNNQLLFDEAVGEDSDGGAESPSATQGGAQGHAQTGSPSKPRNRRKNRRKRKNVPGGAQSPRQEAQQHNLDPTATAVCQRQQQQLRQWQLPYGASFWFLIVCAGVIFAGVLLQFAGFWVGTAPELSGLSEVPETGDFPSSSSS